MLIHRINIILRSVKNYFILASLHLKIYIIILLELASCADRCTIIHNYALMKYQYNVKMTFLIILYYRMYINSNYVYKYASPCWFSNVVVLLDKDFKL